MRAEMRNNITGLYELLSIVYQWDKTYDTVNNWIAEHIKQEYQGYITAFLKDPVKSPLPLSLAEMIDFDS